MSGLSFCQKVPMAFCHHTYIGCDKPMVSTTPRPVLLCDERTLEVLRDEIKDPMGGKVLG